MKKGQAAMEYLMTYGWAILIVIVVVAALYAMGVFRIGAPPVPCSPCFSNFAYVDYAGGILKIRSGSRQIISLNATYNPAITPYESWAFVDTITPGTTLTIGNASLPIITGTYTITLSYVDADSGLTHTDTATLKA